MSDEEVSHSESEEEEEESDAEKAAEESGSEEESEEEEEEEEEKEAEKEEVVEEAEVEQPKSEDEAVQEEKEESEPEDTGPSEAELAMRKRKREEFSGLDETAQDLLEQNQIERDQMEKEIREMRAKNERRKKERAEEDRKNALKRQEEENRRKAEEEERKRKKEEEEQERRDERAQKMAEFEKMKNPQKRNFVITKRDGTVCESAPGESSGEEKKSREQLEAERQAILSQRIQPLAIDGFDAAKLSDRAKELHTQIKRLEGEKYDLEKQFKEQQLDMMELAERARQMNKVDRQGLKRLMDEVDKIQERFAGAPSKIVMYSQFERQKDNRSYVDRRTIFTGPQYGFAAKRVEPTKVLSWNEDGLPMYDEGGAMPQPVAAQEE